MRLILEAELKALGCDMDADEFVTRLADLYSETNRFATVDNFRCRWRDVRDFCRLARQEMSLPENCDELIVRTLDNHRREGDLNIKTKAEFKELKKQLAALGIAADVDEFNAILRSTFRDYYGGWTADQLLNRWNESGNFCAIARERLGVTESRAVDSLILAGLLNIRKSKKSGLNDGS